MLRSPPQNTESIEISCLIFYSGPANNGRLMKIASEFAIYE